MIRNIWAVGRNYADHAKELGNQVPKNPLIFLKAGSTATFAANTIELPSWTSEVHHEIELALKFDKNLNIDEACLALDLTERKAQAELKAQGLPWTLAKSFTGSCPLGPYFPADSMATLKNLTLRLTRNGKIQQEGFTSQMIFPLEELIGYVKSHFPVCPGDLLLTGTPAGVGPLTDGDLIEAEVIGKSRHQWRVKKP